MKNIFYLLLLSICIQFSSCSTSNMAMKQPNNHIEFHKSDFDYSPQVSGEATSIKILMIDWARLFNRKTGNVTGENVGSQTEITTINVATQFIEDGVVGAFSAIIPVIGDFGKERVNQFALYEMMKKNPGYDIVLYPQYETKKFVIPFIYSKTTVKATARLGRIKD